MENLKELNLVEMKQGELEEVEGGLVVTAIMVAILIIALLYGGGAGSS